MACYRRWKWSATKTFSTVSKAWYTQQAEGLLSLHEDLKASVAEEATTKAINNAVMEIDEPSPVLTTPSHTNVHPEGTDQ